MVELVHRELTGRIIDAAIEVHRELGPGLLESAYQKCLMHLLERNGMDVQSEVPLPVRFHDVKLDCGYRLDLVVGNAVVVEVKAVAATDPIHEAQLLTYLKLSGLEVGLLLNFHTVRLRDGIKRIVLQNHSAPSAPPR